MSEIETSTEQANEQAIKEAAYKAAKAEYKVFLKEREMLIDAAREAARTFDQAVLAFGSAVFAGSIAFIKDVAPKPVSESLRWLMGSWVLFSVGLLFVMLSFLFSHKACMIEIDVGTSALGNPDYKRPINRYAACTTGFNYLCVFFLFAGLVLWSVFAYKNLTSGGSDLNQPKPQQPSPTDTVKKGYTPPPPPPKAPPAPLPSPPPPTRK